MNKNLDNNLTKIRNFFDLIRNEYPTKEEVYNYLLACKSFVFSQYGLNENDYDITIHFTNSKELDFDEAKMLADENDVSKFEITLKSNKLSNKYYLNEFEKKSKETLSKKDLIEKRQSSILTLTISFLHELGHVFQYIQEPKTMQIDDENKDALIEAFKQTCCLMPNNRKTRLLIKALGKHINALAYMSSPERNADKRAYIYFASILTNLIRVEEDEEMLDFLCSAHNYINKAKKHNYKVYREFSKENREAILKLHDLEFEKELEELSKSLEDSIR